MPPPLPELTQPVNDFADVIDSASAAEIDRMIRALQAATGDAVVVATVPTIEPYGDIREYAVKLFENRGRGIGDKGEGQRLLILLAVKERRVRVEVGYGLEQWITDGFAGETSREVWRPSSAAGRYGAGLRLGTERIVGRIAQGRNVTLEGVRVPRGRATARQHAVSDLAVHPRVHRAADRQPDRRRLAAAADSGAARLERLVERRRPVRRRLGRRRLRRSGRRIRRRLRRLRRRAQRRRRRGGELVTYG